MASIMRSTVRASSSRLPVMSQFRLYASSPFIPPSTSGNASTPSPRSGESLSRSQSTPNRPIVRPTFFDMPKWNGTLVDESLNKDKNWWWRKASSDRQNATCNTHFTSRTINIPRSVDFKHAMGRLTRLVRRTGLPKMIRKRRVYEKPSEERLRLSSERHRRRFKAMVSYWQNPVFWKVE